MIIMRITKKFATVSGGFYSRKKVGDKGICYFDQATITAVQPRGFRNSDGDPAVFLTAKVPIENFHLNKSICLSDDELQKWGL